MSVPPWMMPDPPEHPAAGDEWFPHIIGHEIVGDGTVRVTWALPGLNVATVTVPLSSWLDGEHQRTGAMLANLIRRQAT